jgi:hypothetical protein
MKPNQANKRAIHCKLNFHTLSREFLMSETNTTPESEYLHTQPEDVESLVNKLMRFYQEFNSQERALLLECIKRGLPASTGKDPLRTVEASPAVFATWLNSVVSNPSRWYPS